MWIHEILRGVGYILNHSAAFSVTVLTFNHRGCYWFCNFLYNFLCSTRFPFCRIWSKLKFGEYNEAKSGQDTRSPGAPRRRTPHGSLRTARTPAPRRQISQSEAEKDPVEVFCRLRPGEEDNNCVVRIASDSTVQLAPLSSSKSYVSGKELQCSFKCKLVLPYYSC